LSESLLNKDESVRIEMSESTVLKQPKFKLSYAKQLNIQKGKLVMVVGDTASGKTAFLNSLLGELMGDTSTIHVNGRVALVP
jgi:ABC-type transport system involved in cytochrome bd biosynthesis fused ATPase/permease subunit